MIVETPAEIDQVVFDAELMLGVPDGVRGAERGQQPDARVAVTIGQPLCWPVPASAVARDHRDALVVRFACSFRPDRRSSIEWARFQVELENGAPPLAADLYPMDVTDESVRNVTIAVSPRLRFAAVEGELGRADLAFQIKEVKPIVTAWGGQEAVFGWDLQPGDAGIRGVNHFYAVLVTVRHEVRARLVVEADVRSAGGPLRRGRVQAAESTTVTLRT